MAQDLQVVGFVAVHPNGREYRYDRALPIPPSRMDVMIAKDSVVKRFKADFNVECVDVLVGA